MFRWAMEILLFALRDFNVSVGSFWLSLCIESYLFLTSLRKFLQMDLAPFLFRCTLLRFKSIDEFIFTCSIKHKFLSPQSFLRHSFTWATSFENWSPLGVHTKILAVVFFMSNLFAMSIIFFDISLGCFVDFKSFVPIWMMALFGDCLTEGWVYACISSVVAPGNDFPITLLVLLVCFDIFLWVAKGQLQEKMSCNKRKLNELELSS